MRQSDVTLLLQNITNGVGDAQGRLMNAVYDELRALAAAKLSRERLGHTLQPTELVNEAYIRLAGNQHRLEDRAHFFGAAAKAMERVLIDHARAKNAEKRGGRAARTTLTDLVSSDAVDSLDVLSLHDAVERLERESEELAMLVRFRYFLGLSLEETAELLAMSLPTAKRRWTFARAWLHDQLGPETAA